ncbi:MAG: PHP domain-containing protein, partial [Gemmatimonadota bacterium]
GVVTPAAGEVAEPVDLHVHSDASDGTVTPGEVVRRAIEAGLHAIALTDHDTVAGLEEAAAEAARLGLGFLPASELSANEPGRSVHLLAYGFDPMERTLLAFLSVYDADRRRRAREIVNRLRTLGVLLTYAEVEEEAGRAAPTRAHVARALVGGFHVGSQEEAFRRWLSRGRPAFVEKRPTPPREAIERVHAAGGVVLLAHPGRAQRLSDLARWVEDGLDGVEVIHPNNPPGVRARMAMFIAERGLLRSGGSDWHGPGTHRGELGEETAPAEWMREIEARCPALAR